MIACDRFVRPFPDAPRMLVGPRTLVVEVRRRYAGRRKKPRESPTKRRRKHIGRRESAQETRRRPGRNRPGNRFAEFSLLKNRKREVRKSGIGLAANGFAIHAAPCNAANHLASD